MEKVIGYVRVSTTKQADEGVSIEDQVKKIEAYCFLQDLSLAGIEIDAGVSGKNTDRPGLQKCLAMMESGKVKGIVIAKLDRLSRSVIDMGKLVRKYFGDGKSDLHCVAESINTKTAAGKLVLTILTAVSEWERETIVERVVSGMTYCRKQGIHMGRVGYGKEHSEEKEENSRRRKIVAKEDEILIIREIKNLHRQGESYRAICDVLNGRAVPGPRGGKWHPSAISRIIRREK